MIRMKYIGKENGFSTLVNQRFYVGDASAHQYVDVPPEDVAGLEETKQWQRVTPPAPVEPRTVIDASDGINADERQEWGRVGSRLKDEDAKNKK